MKILAKILSLLALVSLTNADVPSKPPLSRYMSLWNDSPITEKPLPTPQGPVSNPLENYSLIGVAPIKGGYIITMVDKNDRTNKEIINTTKPTDYKVISVDRTPGKSFSTSVTIESPSGVQGTVVFERDIVKPIAQQQAKPNTPNNNVQTGAPSPNPGQPATIVNGAVQVQNPQAPIQAPRPRIVSSKDGNAGGANNQQNQNRGPNNTGDNQSNRPRRR